eukprot:2330947-Prymnesium_polylepis.1
MAPERIDNAFIRAHRREVDAEVELVVPNEESDDSTLLQHEFVGALLRLAVLRLQQGSQRRDSIFAAEPQHALVPPGVGVVAHALDVLIEQRVKPFMVKLGMDDALSLALKGRGCKAVRRMFEDKLQVAFLGFARDRSPAGAGAGDETMSMNLGELVAMLKEAQVLDDRCTMREVTTFFVLANVDDELNANRTQNRCVGGHTHRHTSEPL